MKKLGLALGSVLGVAVALCGSACSSNVVVAAHSGDDAGSAGDDGAAPDDAGQGTPHDAAAEAGYPPVGACPAAPPSKCTPKSEVSLVRGIAHFDPAHFAGTSTKPSLVIFLNHQFIVSQSEATRGGHPHAYKMVSNVDVTKGEIAFDIDLCEFGIAMWSEENCGFNLVLMLDENGDNDPDTRGVTAMVPTTGELSKMTPIDVSCHAQPTCLDVTLDCTGGSQCTTYTPLTSCACTTPGCQSDSVICK